MAVLTWRNVEAPNVGPAIDGYRSATMMLNSAVSGLDRGLADFQQSQMRRADNQILREALTYQDPNAYRAALASGALFQGVNPEQVSTQALGALGNRASDLLGQVSADQRLEQGALNLQEGRFNFDTRVNNEQDRQQAVQVINDVLQSSATVDEARVGLEGSAGEMTPGAFALARDAVGRQFPGVYGPMGMGGGGAASGAPRGASPGTGGSGAPVPSLGSGTFAASIPFEETRNYVASITGKAGNLSGSNAEKVDQLMPFLIQQESGGNASARSSKGAFGMAQLMPATAREMERKLGLPEGETDRNPEANVQAGRAYLLEQMERFDGNVEQALAAYNAGPGNVQEWLKKPAPNSRAVNNAQGTAASTMIGQTLMQNQSTGLSADVAETMSDTRSSPLDVATRMTGKEGSFSEEDRGFLVGRINRMIEDSKVNGTPTLNAATAGAILERSTEPADGVLSSVVRGLNTVFGAVPSGVVGQNNPNLANGLRLNDDAIAAQVESMRTGQPVDQLLVNQRTAELGQSVASAQERYNQAAAALQQYALRATTQPGLARNLPQYQQRLASAEAALQRAVELQRTSGGLNPQVARTQVEQLERPVARSSGTGQQGESPIRVQEVLNRALEW